MHVRQVQTYRINKRVSRAFEGKMEKGKVNYRKKGPYPTREILNNNNQISARPRGSVDGESLFLSFACCGGGKFHSGLLLSGQSGKWTTRYLSSSCLFSNVLG